MAKFATGRNAWAISDRSGFRYKYQDMRKEWNGLLVGKDEYESKQPQLGPFRKVDDPEALKNARPPQDVTQERSVNWGWNPVGQRYNFDLTPNTLKATASVGDVQVETT